MNDQKSSNRLVSIVGLTATGKTSLSLWLAKQLIAQQKIKGVSLISADSRQVYRGMEIITGADVPEKFKPVKVDQTKTKYRFFKHQELPLELHGVSIIYPDQDWSVAHFRNLAIINIKQAWQKDYLPIIVGGTGFYHLQLFNNDPDPYIKPQPKLRQKAEDKSVDQLQNWLKKISQEKLEQMNKSDRNNPRRLIRAIEVAKATKNPSNRVKNRPIFKVPEYYDVIGLKLPMAKLEPRIKKRVVSRFTQGAIQEVENLLALDLDKKSPPMTATGVESIKNHLADKLNSTETIKNWTQTEVQYAKRQKTWWKKRKKIAWFRPDQPKYQQKIFKKLVSELQL
jgi:tRNA dimethylallyltransferase